MSNNRRHQQGQILMISLVTVVALSFIGMAAMQLANSSAMRETGLYRSAQCAWRVKGASDYAVWQLFSKDNGSSNGSAGAIDTGYDWGFDGEQLSYPLYGAFGIEDLDASMVMIEVSAPDPTDTSVRAVRAETNVHGKGNVALRHLIDVARPPPALGLAILTQDDLVVTGTTEVTSHTDAVGTINADIHTNGNLVVQGSAHVNGFASASGEADVAAGSVEPPQNPDNLPPFYEGIDPVDIPDIDPASFADDPGVVVVNPAAISNQANLNFGGTPENPVTIYVNGDWLVSGQTKITGNVIVVVNGLFKMAGNTNFLGPQNSNSGITVIAREVSTRGTSTIEGLVYARETMTLGGTSAIYGSAISRSYNNVDGTRVGGTFDVYYRPTNENMFPVQGKPFRLSYQTRRPGQEW